jgi:hypothetical protein
VIQDPDSELVPEDYQEWPVAQEQQEELTHLAQ